MSIIGLFAEECVIGNTEVKSLSGLKVEEIGGSVQCFNPVSWWHAGLEKERSENVVSGPDDALGFAILLGSMRA